MNRDDIIRMAQEAGGIVLQPYDYGGKPDRMILHFDRLQKFAALIAEDCAKRCDAEFWAATKRDGATAGVAAGNCAEAIREAYKP